MSKGNRNCQFDVLINIDNREHYVSVETLDNHFTKELSSMLTALDEIIKEDADPTLTVLASAQKKILELYRDKVAIDMFMDCYAESLKHEGSDYDE